MYVEDAIGTEQNTTL